MKFILAFYLGLFAEMGPASVAEEHLVLCPAGLGNFSSKFTTGVTVTVDLQKREPYSTHSCEASLSWSKDMMPIAQESQEIDIDAMGANLGMNIPVVAFQIKERSRTSAHDVHSLFTGKAAAVAALSYWRGLVQCARCKVGGPNRDLDQRCGRSGRF